MVTAKKAVAKKAASKSAGAKKAASKTTAAKKAGSRSAGRKLGPALQLLVDDHELVKSCFEDYEDLAENDAPAEERKELAEKICGLLTVHTTIEEEIFYPAARDALDEEDDDLLDEAEVEHASAKDLIGQIQSMEPDDDLYDAKVKVLGEYVNHHVQEEENEMFPSCEKSELDQDALLESMTARKEELMAELGLEA